MHRRFFSVVLVLLFAAGLYAQAAAGEAPGGATETAQSAAHSPMFVLSPVLGMSGVTGFSLL